MEKQTGQGKFFLSAIIISYPTENSRFYTETCQTPHKLLPCAGQWCPQQLPFSTWPSPAAPPPPPLSGRGTKPRPGRCWARGLCPPHAHRDTAESCALLRAGPTLPDVNRFSVAWLRAPASSEQRRPAGCAEVTCMEQAPGN